MRKDLWTTFAKSPIEMCYYYYLLSSDTNRYDRVYRVIHFIFFNTGGDDRDLHVARMVRSWYLTLSWLNHGDGAPRLYEIRMKYLLRSVCVCVWFFSRGPVLLILQPVCYFFPRSNGSGFGTRPTDGSRCCYQQAHTHVGKPAVYNIQYITSGCSSSSTHCCNYCCVIPAVYRNGYDNCVYRFSRTAVRDYKKKTFHALLL